MEHGCSDMFGLRNKRYSKMSTTVLSPYALFPPLRRLSSEMGSRDEAASMPSPRYRVDRCSKRVGILSACYKKTEMWEVSSGRS